MDPDTWKILLEYFDYRQFLASNPPLRLACIFGGMCLMAAAIHALSPWCQRRLEAFAARKYHLEGGGSAPSGKGAGGKGADGGDGTLNAMDFAMFERVMVNLRRRLYLAILAWGAHMLRLAPAYATAIASLFSIICTITGIAFVASLVPFNLDLYMRRHGETLKTSQTRSLMPIITGIIWAVGLTFLLDNMGFHVSTIIAGLGIVGVAVGLAGQAILADFFSYIVILLDKPFRIGDHVQLAGGKAGDVEYMGPKTTHLRSLEGDLIICANSEMTRGVIVNLGSVRERPVVLEIGVAYETPMDVVRRVPDILREVVDSFPRCSFDRACMLGFGTANYRFQLLYVVRQSGIREFQLTRSAVNLAIQERLNAGHIPSAYPTTHVLLTETPQGAGPAAGAAPAPAADPGAGAASPPPGA